MSTTLLLDKTGTITLGNRQAESSSCPPTTCRSRNASWPTQHSSRALADETPEGRSSIVVLAEPALRPAGAHRRRVRRRQSSCRSAAQTRMSGVDLDGDRLIRKGAARAVDWLLGGRGRRRPWRRSKSGQMVNAIRSARQVRHAAGGRRPDVGTRAAAGVRASCTLKDVVKPKACESGSTNCVPDGYPDGDDNRRQSRLPQKQLPTRLASTTFWPKRRPRTRWR